MSRYKSRRKNKVTAGSLGLALIIILIVFGFRFLKEKETEPTPVLPDSSMQMHIIDVGQGDSILFTNEGNNILIDAGPSDGEEALLEYLESIDIEKFDYVIATHPHEDHIGGMDKIIENYPIDNFIMTDLPESMIPTTRTYEKMIDLLIDKDVNVVEAKAGNEYAIGNMELDILTPLSTDYDNLNNFSIVTTVSFEGKRVLLSGDAEKEVESELLKSGADLSCDIYKVAHHGSDTSNTKKFLKAMSPKYGAISVAEDNSYGHPHKEVVERLTNAGIEFYTTADKGDIIFDISSDGISVYS